MNNKKLIEHYPWLRLRSKYTDELLPNMDNYTELDDMPEGWRIAFGEKMCEEIHQVLLKTNSVDNYRILQIKEKYGSLCWHHTFAPDELEPIINKYIELSKKTCVVCGRPATKIHKNWYEPLCDECTENRINDYKKQFIPLKFD